VPPARRAGTGTQELGRLAVQLICMHRAGCAWPGCTQTRLSLGDALRGLLCALVGHHAPALTCGLPLKLSRRDAITEATGEQGGVCWV
jgi:hypothetical protein